MLRRSCMAGLLVLALVFAFAGCSDNSTGNNKVIGDPNAPEFQNMKAAIQVSIDSTIATALQFAADPGKYAPADDGRLRPDWGVMNPEDTLLHNFNNGWNIIYLGLTTGVDYNRTLVDSVRFMIENGVVDQYFTYHVGSMDYIHHGTDTYKGTEDTYHNSSTYVNLDYTGFSTGGGTINGLGKFVWDDYYVNNGTATHDNYQFNTNFNAMAFTQPTDPPHTAGVVVSGTMTLTASVTTGQTTKSWTGTVTFNANGTGTVVISTGNTEYTFNVTPTF